MLWLVAILLGIPVLIYLLAQFIDGNYGYWTKKGIFSLHQNQIASLWDRLRFKVPFQTADCLIYQGFKKAGVPYGGTNLFRHPLMFIMDLEVVKGILVKDFDHFVNRKIFSFGDGDPMFDKMLLNQENQEWKDLRSTMTPTFTTGKIKRMFGIFNSSGDKMVEYLKNELKSSHQGEIELREVCGRYTMDVIASSAFGVESQTFKDKNAPFAVMGHRMQDTLKPSVLLRFVLLILVPKLFKFFKFSFFDQTAFDFFTGVLRENIRTRQKTGEKRDDFLQLMIEARADQEKQEKLLQDMGNGAQNGGLKPIKSPLTEDTILAQCLLFFIAGFDATETLLIYAAYEVALQPEIQERLVKEIQEATESTDGVLTHDIVYNMEYLDMIISETLRKYPPAIRLERKCTMDYKIPNSDTIITKGSHIVVPTYGIHYDEEYYPDPQKFDPERFSTESKANRHPFAYMPFGIGPRHCIAQRFALLEGKTAIAHLFQNFVIQPCSKTLIPIEYNTAGILKPKTGMWLQMEPRSK